MWSAFIVAFVITAAAADVRWGIIPRRLTVPAFLIGIVYHSIQGGLPSALAAAALGFAIGMLLFQLGAVGGGDVKLITALGAMLGLHPWIVAMFIAVLAAAFMGVVQMIRGGVARQTLRNVKAIVIGLGKHGLQPHPYLNVRNPAALRSPFGLAAALGTLVAVIR